MDIPSYEDVQQAHERIAPHLHRTPVLTSSYLNQLTGAQIFFKCENLQKVGAFKARGATNAVFGLSDMDAANGVATHSSGNHGAALSFAAARRGIDATVVMPNTAPVAKKDAVRGYGGRILECEPTQAAREAMLAQVIADTGADEVHPYDDRRVIAGQATCAVELHEDIGQLDAVIAPIGGGGLISGTSLTMSVLSPTTKIYAAEPTNADDAYRSFHAGELLRREAQTTVADGLRTNLCPLTWHFVSNHLSDILLAAEDEILDAMYLTWQRMKIIIEPSAAVPLAVMLRNKAVFEGQRVGVILTGGNVDFDR